MADTPYIYVYENVDEELQALIDNQTIELERLQTISEQIDTQISIQQEQLNGIASTASSLLTGMSFIVICVLLVIVWKVINWFFKGV